MKLLKVSALLILIPGLLFAQEMGKPIWNIGDTWTYKIVTSRGGGEKKEIIQKRIFLKEEEGMYVVSAARGNINTYYDASNLNAKYVKDASGKVIERYIPEKPTFDWPLKVGKKWRARYSWESTFASPDDPPYVDVTVKVVALEPVTVMGRETMTFKLLEKRYNPRGALVAEITQWVSLEFKNIVKRKDERELAKIYSEGELIEFTPAKPTEFAPKIP
jgi:hypothetical protein